MLLAKPPRDTDWLKNSRWGIFVHYLSGKASDDKEESMTVDRWNRRIDAFDVETLADQLAEYRVPYFGFTIGQNSGFYCSPNKTYDEIMGLKPSKCSQRDLIFDLAAALEKRGIRFMAYLPSQSPENDAIANEKFQRRPRWHGPGWLENPTHDRLIEMQVRWEEVIREWSCRWGKKDSAWWVDGVYTPEAMYRHAEAPNFTSFLGAFRAGNAEALVALNPGICRQRVLTIADSGEDYTAGEMDFALLSPGRDYQGNPLWPGRWIDGKQFHLLTYLGEWWGNGAPRFTPQLVASYTELVNQHEGVITWDLPIDIRGQLPSEYFKHLAALSTIH